MMTGSTLRSEGPLVICADSVVNEEMDSAMLPGLSTVRSTKITQKTKMLQAKV